MTRPEWCAQLETSYHHVADQATAQTDVVERVRLWDECATLARWGAERAEQDGAVETARRWRQRERAAQRAATVHGGVEDSPT